MRLATAQLPRDGDTTTSRSGTDGNVDGGASSTDGAKIVDGKDNNDNNDDGDDGDEEGALDDTMSAAEAHRLKEQGNGHFRSREYARAAELYAQAGRSGQASRDERAVYHSNRSAALLHLQQHEAAEAAATRALALRPTYIKARVRRRTAREARADWRGALEDAEVLGAPPAERDALRRRAEHRETAQRDEAMQSLKGLGNSLLSNFGMSLDDFAVEQDGSSGSYNVKMK